jgi:hypothetical protein
VTLRKSRILISVIGVFLLAAGVAVRADSGGQLQDVLRRAIIAASQGKCPAELMTPLLRSQCEDQQPGMGQRIAALGQITSIDFMGTQTTPGGPAEIYKVTHEKGRLTWMISTDSQGKIVILWTPGS